MRTLYKILLIYSCIFAILFPGFGQSLHRNYEHKFRVEIPKDWEVRKPKGPNIALSLFDRNTRAMIIIDVRNSIYPPNIHEVSQEMIIHQYGKLPEFKLLRLEQIYLNSHKALQIEYEYRWQSLDIDVIFKAIVYEVVYNKKLYTISCIAETSSFQGLISIFKKSVSTFIIEEDLLYSTKLSTDSLFFSLEDNFAVLFLSYPNIVKKDDYTTYSVTSLEDTAIFRINVFTDNNFISNNDEREEYITNFMNETKSNYDMSGIRSKFVVFNGLPAITAWGENLTYGDIQSLGFKGLWKSTLFFDENKIYTIQVTSTIQNLEYAYEKFIKSFILLD